MRKFKTESQKLLDLVINSIYTNREIFLRELISNASDAIDKLYFKSLTDTSIKLSKEELAIRVSFDKEARTLTVSDSGIGMDADELDHNLGTIAHSGTNAFREESADAQGSDIDVIGQFGVGFYSAFMVAKQVEVISKPYGAEVAHLWVSDGMKGYTLEETEKASHGTDVILTLKDDTDDDNYTEYLSESNLQRLIRKYSNYVRYPIQMELTKTRTLPKPEDAPEDYTPETEEYTELETINSMIPIWKRHGSEVSQDEYDEFYRTTFHDFTAPARTFTIHAEGALSYDALLFVPGAVPFDLYTKDFHKGLALYSSGVMIMEHCEELLPDCFAFVRGIVDSEDLSLNISRETLQHNNQLTAIARRIEKKVKSELADMRDNDREHYEHVFDDFGRTMKYSLFESYGMSKDLLADLFLFHSAKLNKMVTLDEYVDAADEEQKTIFFAVGESVEGLAKMPIVTSVLDRGYDVLLCTQDVDELCMMAVGNYRDHDVKNVGSGDLGLDTDEEKDAVEAQVKANTDMLEAMKDALGDKVVKVTISPRAGDAAACITTEGPVSLDMERRFAHTPSAGEAKASRVLELNAEHPVFASLKAAFSLGDTDKVDRYTSILYDQALLVAGMPIDDPVAYAQAVCELMK